VTRKFPLRKEAVGSNKVTREHCTSTNGKDTGEMGVGDSFNKNPKKKGLGGVKGKKGYPKKNRRDVRERGVSFHESDGG